MESGIVKTNHEFFKKEKKSYHNWTMALIREAIQNSKDAKSSVINIDLEYTDDSENELRIEFTDNGIGMDKNILINTLLTMGGSNKSYENGDVGGFGYAKVILFFAHNKYSIHSGKHLINGVGGSYTYQETQNIQKGTKLVIYVDSRTYSSNLNKFSDAVHTITNHSNLEKLDIFLNKNKIITKKERFEYELNTKLGKVKFKDSDNQYSGSTLWVRVGGLSMFEHTIYMHSSTSDNGFYGVLDLIGNPIELLTTNRDGLQHEYQKSLTTIFQKLSVERQKYSNEEMFNFIVNEKEPIKILEDSRNGEDEYFENIETTTNNTKGINVNNTPADNINTINRKTKSTLQYNRDNFYIDQVFKDLEAEKGAFESFFKEQIIKINENFYPHNFCISTEKSDLSKTEYREFFKKLIMKRNIKIACAWNYIVREVLKSEYFTENYQFSIQNNENSFQGVNIYTGFIFGKDDTLGMNSFDKRINLYRISINPTSDFLDYSIEELIDIAIHECTHFLVSEHSSYFIFEEFKIKKSFRKIANIPQIKKNIKSIIKKTQHKNQYY